MEGANLIYCAPTSGGKTLGFVGAPHVLMLLILLFLVAEILMMRMFQRLRKKALFILPYISVVTEKVAHLEAVFASMSLCVQGYYGGHGSLTLERRRRR